MDPTWDLTDMTFDLLYYYRGRWSSSGHWEQWDSPNHFDILCTYFKRDNFKSSKTRKLFKLSLAPGVQMMSSAYTYRWLFKEHFAPELIKLYQLESDGILCK